MKKRIALFRSQSAIVGALALCVGVIAPSVMHAEDWLDSIQDARCAPEDIEGVSNYVRNAIEASVRRAEMAIQAPTPVGDLACLTDLMTAPLDTFSQVGGLLDSLTSGLGDISTMSLNLDMDVSGMICAYAAEKFATLTNPLSELDTTISGFASMASDSADRLSGALSSAFTDLSNTSSSTSWSSANLGTDTGLGSYSGVLSTTDSSGYSGSIADYTLPDMSASESDVEEVTYSAVDDETFADNSDAWNEYNQRLMRALGQYIGCRVAGELDGTRVVGTTWSSATWNVPGSITDCTFNPGSWPALFYSAGDGTIEVTPEASSAAEAEVQEIDRVGGQARPEETQDVEGATSAPSENGNTIWDMLGR